MTTEKTHKITRETSKYNKYMKWHLVTSSENFTRSDWFKTRKEAEYAIEKSKNVKSYISAR